LFTKNWTEAMTCQTRAYYLTKLALLALLLSISSGTALAQETVSVSTPAFVAFNVIDVGSSSTGSPSSARVSFSSANLTPGHRLRISVMADSADFSPPSSGGTINSSLASWTVTGSQGGTGSSGTVSHSSFSQVFESAVDPVSGSVDLRFTLSATGSGIRAGDHDLPLRWQFESIP
jgi:hypothetical protein